MMKNRFYIFLMIVCLSLPTLGMSRRGQYDEDARNAEKIQKEMKKSEYSATQPVQDIASGVKQATYDSTKGLLKDTAEETAENAPVIGTVKGLVKGSGKVLENTSKGIAKVATLGRADSNSFRVEEPEHGKDGDTSKVKFNF